jgi:3-hydroxyisobutyrate dehydrogenase
MLPTTTLLSRGSTLGWIGLGAMGGPMATNLYTKAWALANSRKSAEMPEMVICEPNDANAAAFVDGVKAVSGEEAAQRVRRVGKPSEVAAEAARVFTMLPSTPQVEAVYLGEGGLLAGLKGVQSGSLSDHVKANPWLIGAGAEPAGTTSAGTLLVDHTTLDPTAAKRIADDVHAQTNNSVHMIDGPVSGGESREREG